MRKFWQTFRAELVKQHHDSFGGKTVFFSLLFWPVLAFLSNYYSFKQYRSGTGSSLERVLHEGNIPLFILSGFLVFQIFWTVVQSAVTFEWERKQGTLETIYLTPSSKMSFLYGRSVYSLFTGIWMFFVFCIMTFLLVADLQIISWSYLILSFLLMIISAVIWGAFLCALCLFSRDSGYLFYIFQGPMNLFGGVRVPPSVFPLWAKIFAIFFPVSYCLILLRQALYEDINPSWWIVFTGLILFNIFLVTGTYGILSLAERHVRKRGSWTLF